MCVELARDHELSTHYYFERAFGFEGRKEIENVCSRTNNTRHACAGENPSTFPVFHLLTATSHTLSLLVMLVIATAQLAAVSANQIHTMDPNIYLRFVKLWALLLRCFRAAPSYSFKPSLKIKEPSALWFLIIVCLDEQAEGSDLTIVRLPFVNRHSVVQFYSIHLAIPDICVQVQKKRSWKFLSQKIIKFKQLKCRYK